MTAVTLRFTLVLIARQEDILARFFYYKFSKDSLKRNKIYYLKIGLFIRFVFVMSLNRLFTKRMKRKVYK